MPGYDDIMPNEVPSNSQVAPEGTAAEAEPMAVPPVVRPDDSQQNPNDRPITITPYDVYPNEVPSNSQVALAAAPPAAAPAETMEDVNREMESSPDSIPVKIENVSTFNDDDDTPTEQAGCPQSEHPLGGEPPLRPQQVRQSIPTPHFARISADEEGLNGNEDGDDDIESEGDIAADINGKLPRPIFVWAGKARHSATLLSFKGQLEAQVRWDMGYNQVVARASIEELDTSTASGAVYVRKSDHTRSSKRIRLTENEGANVSVKEAAVPAGAVAAPGPVPVATKKAAAAKQTKTKEKSNIPEKESERLTKLVSGLLRSKNPSSDMASLYFLLEKGYIKEACNVGAPGIVVTAMQTWPSVRGVQYWCLVCIQVFAVDHHIAKDDHAQAKKTIVKCGGLEAIASAMKHFSKDRDIQWACCNTLDTLTDDRDATCSRAHTNAWVRLLQEDVPHIVTNMNETFRDDAKYLHYACEFLAHLAGAGEKYRTIMRKQLIQVINAVLAAMQRHKSGSQVNKSGDNFMKAVYGNGSAR